jgi:hypothetical protein
VKGDPTLTREAFSQWREGQRRCRARKRHNWGPYTVYEHKVPGSRSAVRYEVVEQCSHCRNRRRADFVTTQYGLRQVDRWAPEYREGYLLPKGAMAIDDDLRDELVASDILSRKIIEVLDDDGEDE